jgi:hypothetical protein
MPSLRDFDDATLAAIVGNMSFTAGALAIQTASSASYKTTNTITYAADGIVATKTAVATQSLVTNSNEGYTAAQMTVPINKTAYFVVTIKGSDASIKNFAGMQLNPDGTLTWTGKLPNIPAGFTPIGYIKVVTGSTTFVPGTTALDATTGGMAITFKDLAVLPLAESP